MERENQKVRSRNGRYNWLDPGFEQTDEHPVVNVAWNDAQAFISWLSRKEGSTFRLPSRAEWEYCVRAKKTERLLAATTGDWRRLPTLPTARLKRNILIRRRFGTGLLRYTEPVGKFRSNAWDLFDMHGNVWEWCWDEYEAGYYKQSPAEDPPGPEAAVGRVFRGGSWNIVPQLGRGRRTGSGAGRWTGTTGLGFRVARVQGNG